MDGKEHGVGVTDRVRRRSSPGIALRLARKPVEFHDALRTRSLQTLRRPDSNRALAIGGRSQLQCCYRVSGDYLYEGIDRYVRLIDALHNF